MVLYDPARYAEHPVRELLQAAAHGYIGIDRRLIRTILDRGEEAVAATLAFAAQPAGDQRVYMDPLLVDLIRQWKTPEALDFLIEVVRRNLDDITDELIFALLPMGERAIEPLLKLYHELEEEQSSEVAFLLAGQQVRDARILEVLLERLEYDVADGALCLGLYGDPAAQDALQAMLAEIPAEEKSLRGELEYAIGNLRPQAQPDQPPAFDILADYPERVLPALDELEEAERFEMLDSPDADTRAAAAYTYFNRDLDPKTRQRLLEMARSDAEAKVRGRAWMSLADAAEDEAVRAQLLAVAGDTSRDVAERGGAAVGLYGVAERPEVSALLDALYQEGGTARARALETMWRSIWKPYARYFPAHLEDSDKDIVRQALRGAGYFQLASYVDKIASYFDREDEWEDLRDDALFAYALAMPGETTRGRVRGMLRKIDSLTHLVREEAELVMFALDERLALHGLDPVFAAEDDDQEPLPAPAPELPKKVGRNDPCPCGSGKKYKKCHGA